MEPEPEPDRVDLSPLDPSRDKIKWQTSSARIATRAAELRKLRRKVVRRAAFAVVLSAAAGITLWLSAPKPRHTRATHHRQGDMLDWATRDNVDPYELLDLGVGHAQ
jgi:hypothetical protein